ncbi:hypothetical protein [Halomarina rubra]|uniref:Uncharacterized protein n=1 Tax=Halomarina rubra TaxID=2071873 RepID=A0ABD6AVC6_9EURY|nr:hypothetical protein [Halomarina rubra]
MVIFLAGRSRINDRSLHNRIKNRLQSDEVFEEVSLQVANRRDPGPYRVIAHTDPRGFLEDASYPTTTARLEIGFDTNAPAEYEYYWINWIEPERQLMVGWHQDDDHEPLGPVHLQVNQETQAIAHTAAHFVDEHPMSVLDARLQQLPAAVSAIEWDGKSVIGIEWET